MASVFRMGAIPTTISIASAEPRLRPVTDRSSLSSSSSDAWTPYPTRGKRWFPKEWLKIIFPKRGTGPLLDANGAPIRSMLAMFPNLADLVCRHLPSLRRSRPRGEPSIDPVGTLAHMLLLYPANSIATIQFLWDSPDPPLRQIDPFVRFLEFQSLMLVPQRNRGSLDLPALTMSPECGKEATIASASDVVENSLHKSGLEIPDTMWDTAMRWSRRDWITPVQVEGIWLMLMHHILVAAKKRQDFVVDLGPPTATDETIRPSNSSARSLLQPEDRHSRLLAAIEEDAEFEARRRSVSSRSSSLEIPS